MLLAGPQGAGLDVHTAHGVADHADPAGVHIGQGAQVLQCGIGAAALGRGHGRVGLTGQAVAVGIDGDHHIAPAGQLDGVDVLHLGGVVVAVAGHDRRCGGLRGGRVRDVEQSPLQAALTGHVLDVPDRHRAKSGVDQACQKGKNQDHCHQCSGPYRPFSRLGPGGPWLLVHNRPPFCTAILHICPFAAGQPVSLCGLLSDGDPPCPLVPRPRGHRPPWSRDAEVCVGIKKTQRNKAASQFSPRLTSLAE